VNGFWEEGRRQKIEGRIVGQRRGVIGDEVYGNKRVAAAGGAGVS
jgi:hypothetical protein